MAVAATDLTQVKRWPIGPGRWAFRAKYTAPGTYTAAGEVLSNAVCLAGLGLTRIDRMHCEILQNAGFTADIILAFDHTRTSTTQGKFHAYDQTGTTSGTELGAVATAGFAAMISGEGV